MGHTVIYLIIYILECFIFWQYTTKLFTSRYPRQKEGLCFFSGYFILFLISLTENFTLNVIAFSLVNLLLCIFLYTDSFLATLFHTLLISIIMTASEGIIISISVYFAPDFFKTRNYLYNAYYLITLTVFSKLIYFFLLQVISSLFLDNKTKTGRMDNRYALFCMIPFFSCFVVLTLLVISMNIKLPPYLDLSIAISTILVLSINLLTAWGVSYIQSQDEKKLNLQLQMQKELDTNTYFSMLLNQTEKRQAFIHDIKKHLNSILLLNEEKEHEQLSEYIKKLITSSELQNTAKVSDNKLLNGILQQYIMKCKVKQLDLKIDIRSGVVDFLSYEELTSIFCNLLDNAIAAAEKVPNGFIEVSVKKPEQKTFVIISTINSCIEDESQKNTLHSSIVDSSIHGYGLKIIKEIVHKYHGELETYYEKDSMTFHTILFIYTNII